MPQSAVDGVTFGTWTCGLGPADCDLARRPAHGREPRLPARATPAEAIAGVAQKASESVARDWMGLPGPAQHRTMGGDWVSLNPPAAACNPADLPGRAHVDTSPGAVRAVMRWPGPGGGRGQSPRERKCGIYTGWSWPAPHSRTPKAQVAAEVTCEPRTLLKTIRPFTRPINLTCDGL